MENLSGRQLGDYRLQALIGSGGMGQVYLAEQVYMRTSYAVKVLPESLARTEGFVDRFRDEARVMASLRHPHIVQVHTLSEADGRYFLAMDYVCGPEGHPTNLEEVLAQSPGGRVEPQRCRQWVTQLADALAYAHEQGAIHRDIKPANVLLDGNGKAMLGDFGLVEIAGEAAFRSHHVDGQSLSGAQTLHGGRPAPVDDLDAANTLGAGGGASNGQILGTYDFMAPEQREGGSVDARTDIYALGALAYRLLTGRRVMGAAALPTEVLPNVDPVWDVLYRGCLAYDKADRFPSARHVADTLRGKPVQQVGGAQAQPQTPPPPPPAPQAPPKPSHPAVVSEVLAAIDRCLPKKEYEAARAQADRLPSLGPEGRKAARDVARRFRSLADGLCHSAAEAKEAGLAEPAAWFLRAALTLVPDHAQAKKLSQSNQAHAKPKRPKPLPPQTPPRPRAGAGKHKPAPPPRHKPTPPVRQANSTPPVPQKKPSKRGSVIGVAMIILIAAAARKGCESWNPGSTRNQPKVKTPTRRTWNRPTRRTPSKSPGKVPDTPSLAPDDPRTD